MPTLPMSLHATTDEILSCVRDHEDVFATIGRIEITRGDGRNCSEYDDATRLLRRFSASPGLPPLVRRVCEESIEIKRDPDEFVALLGLAIALAAQFIHTLQPVIETLKAKPGCHNPRALDRFHTDLCKVGEFVICQMRGRAQVCMSELAPEVAMLELSGVFIMETAITEVQEMRLCLYTLGLAELYMYCMSKAGARTEHVFPLMMVVNTHIRAWVGSREFPAMGYFDEPEIIASSE